MENVWETTGRLVNGAIGEGWEDWLGSILGPIAVLIFLDDIRWKAVAMIGDGVHQ